MNKGLTEIVFILDRSGSMESLVQDTIGGFNSFIEKQKTEAGDAKLTTILFDTEYDILHDGLNINDIKPLTNKEYFARGGTALLDAIGKTINVVGTRISKIKKKEQPKVIFVITTDGQENSSKEFTNSTVKEMIEKKTKNGWEFLFLGANIDSFSVANGLGININNTSNYTANSVGTQSLYATLSRTIADYAENGTITTDWAKDIQ